jgi:hypothetical protein
VRLTAKGILAALSAAIVLVLGLDYVTFASTGDSLILGRFNASGTTTTVVNRGTGPVLRLKASGPHVPALAVNTTSKIQRLNADMVDGLDGSLLATRVVGFRAGARGQVEQGVVAWNLPLARGIFEANFTVGIVPSTGSPGAPVSVVCGIVDPRTIGPTTRVYTANSTLYAGGNIPAFVSGATTLRVTKDSQLALVCTSESPQFTLYSPATASFASVTSRTTSTAQPLPLPQRAVAGLNHG